MSDQHLPRKMTLRAHGQKVVFSKRPDERASHVWMKAFLWALYLPEYPTLKVEMAVGDRYKPDVIALNAAGEPLFWGEAGQTTAVKIRSLLKRYPSTHLAIAKWAGKIDPHLTVVQEALADVERHAPVDVLLFPADAPERFVLESGEVRVSLGDVRWVRMGPG